MADLAEAGPPAVPYPESIGTERSRLEGAMATSTGGGSQPAGAGRRKRRIGPIGTLARLAGAGALIFLAVGLGDGVQWWDAALGFVAFPGVVLAAHGLWLRYAGQKLQATSELGFCLGMGAIAALLIIEQNAGCGPALLRQLAAPGRRQGLRRL